MISVVTTLVIHTEQLLNYYYHYYDITAKIRLLENQNRPETKVN